MTPIPKTHSSNIPTQKEAFCTFAKIGFLSFGGPAAQISLMHRLLVEEKSWLTEKQYLNALSFCMLLPGPEAMQLATYAGWRLHGVSGGLIAGLLFVLPGAFVILCLAIIYMLFGNVPLISSLFLGIKAAVLIIVIEALIRVAKRALKTSAHWVIAACSFIGIFMLSFSYPLIVFLAALYGFFFIKNITDESKQPAPIVVPIKKTFYTIWFWMAIWLIPIFVIDQFFGYQILGDIGTFFSKLAVVTFGGAYAVLAYMTQDVVNQFNWLTTGEMMDGLGLAETTPGPLILVTEFVGFIAAFREGGLWLGIAGAALTLWVTFIPCFLWIFVSAPYIEWISAQPRLNGALSAITAAVVGVILSLSLWFGLHVMFAHVTHIKYGPFTIWSPDLASIDWRVVALSSICAIALLWLHWGIAKTLTLSAALGLIMVNVFS